MIFKSILTALLFTAALISDGSFSSETHSGWYGDKLETKVVCYFEEAPPIKRYYDEWQRGQFNTDVLDKSSATGFADISSYCDADSKNLIHVFKVYVETIPILNSRFSLV